MVTALCEGACVVCTEPYALGDELGLLVDGWAHLACWELALSESSEGIG